MKKYNFLYPFLIVLFTFLPIVIDVSISPHIGHFPFTWSLFLIPAILLIYIYRNWKVVLGSLLFFTSLKFTIEISQHFDLNSKEGINLVWSSIINWIIHLMIGHLIIQNEKLLENVRLLTIIDPLTEIHNRRYVDLYMERTLPYVTKTGQSLLVAALDIDHFKEINDQYGHLQGDEVLKCFVHVVKNNIRETDMFARIGGEEFLLVFPDTSLEKGTEIIEQIRKEVAISPLIYKDKAIPITISLGLTKYKKESLEELLEKADQALYQAKETGRNKWVVG